MFESGVAEPFDDGQDECHSLATSGPVSCQDVFALVNVTVGLLLDWVQVLDALLLQDSDGFFSFDEVL